MRRLLPLLFVVVACGGQKTEAEHAETPVELHEEDEGPQEPARPPPAKGTLYRDEVDATIDAGLGYFFQRLDVEAALEGGRFKGFRIVALKTPEFWSDVDLRPGDVVLSVNGMPIETDGQAYKAAQAIKQSAELRVKYVRGGSEREIVFRIVEPPDRSKQPLPPQAAPPKSADAGT